MKRIHYLLLGLLVSLTLAAVSPTTPPVRLVASTNITIVTNGVNNFTLSASGGISAMNQNQFDSSSTNIKSGALFTNSFHYSSGGTNSSISLQSPMFLPTTSAAVPLIATTGAANSGFYSSGTAIAYADAGTLLWYSLGNEFILYRAGGIFTFGSGTDLRMTRNASGVLSIFGSTDTLANRATLLAAKYTGRSGTSSATFNAGGPVYQSTTAVGNVGAGEDDLITQTVAAAALASTGDRLRITCPVTFAANANAKTLKAYWDGTSFYTTGSLVVNSASAVLTIVITRTGAATQNISTSLVSGNTLLAGVSSGFTTGAATLSGAIVFKLTGTATADDDISQKEMLIEYLPAP